jgi:branched-chain amino acid transport system substrate-binding protein
MSRHRAQPGRVSMQRHAANRPRLVLALFLATALVAAFGCSSKDDAAANSNGSGGSGSSAAAAAVLGAPNKATGTPIKIGMVTDGKVDALDGTPQRDAAKAAVQYANDYLGGINGHVIDLDGCETNQTPSGGTTCGVQMINDKVAAVLTGVSGQATTLFDALKGAGIPYFSIVATDQNILLGENAFIATNPIGGIGAGVPIAEQNHVDRAGIIVIDVPEASGPVSQIAKPFYAKAGINLDVITISPQVADMTPQIQQGIANGDKQFMVLGTEEFTASAIKALKQLTFQGTTIVAGFSVDESLVESVPGGFDGVINIGSATDDPNDKDFQTYNAVMDTYAKGSSKTSIATTGFQSVVSFVRALNGVTAAVDAPSISSALAAMPAAVPLAMGGGVTFQCGTKPVSYAPNICTTQILQSTLDEKGKGHDYKVVDVAQFIQLG